MCEQAFESCHTVHGQQMCPRAKKGQGHWESAHSHGK